MSLTSDLADITLKQENQFAAELLPRSINNADALSSGNPELPDIDPEIDTAHALRGIRFKAVSAPGPTGARPEHLREMLAGNNQRITSKLIKSIARFVDTATKGLLPESA